MIQAFIFDVDGTLVDTTALHVASWREAFQEFGVDMPYSSIQPQIGRRALEIAETLAPQLPRATIEAIVDAKWRIYKRYFPQVKPIPKVKELFSFLAKRGVKLALATSTIKRDAGYYVDLLSVGALIDAIVTAEDIKRSKPDPEIFLKASELLKVSPSDAAAVGDSPHDMGAARAAGMLAIGVLTGGYAEAMLREAGADLIYRDIADLLDRIDDVL